MKEIIVLRHGEKQNDELTPTGVEACKALAQRIGGFTVVIASERNRAIQTAELVSGMTARIDPRANVPTFPDSELDKLVEIQKTHPLGIIGAIWQQPSLVEDAKEAGRKLSELVVETMTSLANNERALIVSHDGTMVGLEKLFKKESFDTVDHSFGPLEGITINEDLSVSHFR